MLIPVAAANKGAVVEMGIDLLIRYGRSQIMSHFLADTHRATGFEGASLQTRQVPDAIDYAALDHEVDCPGTVLLVEDESLVREVTHEVLQTAGYRVWIAKDAAQAGEIYRDRGREVDLLLTDVILPGESGRTLATRLRRANPQLKVLYVTGYAEQIRMCNGENEDCLPKPFSASALLERVRCLLDRSRFQTSCDSLPRLACAGA